ncbi:MAG: hypothetical protein NXI04_26825 [Planctomycetaceae bacterium]|nr:hypothetical protein [Planctomycetaceae bacterium]
MPLRRSGSSLADVIAATVLTAAVLVPSTRVLRDSINTGRRLQVQQELLIGCQNVLETEMQAVSQSGRLRTSGGRLNSDSGQLRYTVMSTDQPSTGGVPGLLIVVSALVWEDGNRNKRHDSGEPHVSLLCKIAAP